LAGVVGDSTRYVVNRQRASLVAIAVRGLQRDLGTFDIDTAMLNGASQPAVPLDFVVRVASFLREVYSERRGAPASPLRCVVLACRFGHERAAGLQKHAEGPPVSHDALVARLGS
jgi:hypothetical protein